LGCGVRQGKTCKACPVWYARPVASVRETLGWGLVGMAGMAQQVNAVARFRVVMCGAVGRGR